MERENAWKKYPEGKKREPVLKFGEDYRQFLSDCKTERECVEFFEAQAKAAGYILLQEAIEKKQALKPGDKVYVNQMGKSMALFVMGKEPMEKGMNILGAHIDSPRLDLKQNPLYEDTGLVLLDTHYYGAREKYRVQTLPPHQKSVILRARPILCMCRPLIPLVFHLLWLHYSLSKHVLVPPQKKYII